MKKRITTINGKILVEGGDLNEIKDHELKVETGTDGSISIMDNKGTSTTGGGSNNLALTPAYGVILNMIASEDIYFKEGSSAAQDVPSEYTIADSGENFILKFIHSCEASGVYDGTITITSDTPIVCLFDSGECTISMSNIIILGGRTEGEEGQWLYNFSFHNTIDSKPFYIPVYRIISV